MGKSLNFVWTTEKVSLLVPCIDNVMMASEISIMFTDFTTELLKTTQKFGVLTESSKFQN